MSLFFLCFDSKFAVIVIYNYIALADMGYSKIIATSTSYI